ncbi:MAG: sensor histidine kinase, partial [Calditrichaeota bacterium]|nr:sensor histidine kinase [Calditrichota bacterium]
LVDKQINIIYEDGERYIWFDPGHLRQILMNLIANSIEASPKLGVIRISAEESDKRILIEVQDEGGGLEAGDETKVFEPFFSKKENGTGLGLAISRKLCLENQAEIWATNNADKGCTFFISVNRNNVEQKIERT